MSATAGQQYDIWIQAVAAALKTSGRGFSVRQIDEAEAHAAFIQGVSPVVFARQVSPMPRPKQDSPLVKFSRWTVMKPHGGVIKWSCIFLSISGWIFWLVGAVSLLLAMQMLLGISIVGASTLTSDKPQAAAITLLGFPYAIIQLLFSLFIFVLGSVWHWLAQHLAIVYHQYDWSRRTLP